MTWEFGWILEVSKYASVAELPGARVNYRYRIREGASARPHELGLDCYLQTCFTSGVGESAGTMKLYRINKVAKPGGLVVKTKDVLAQSDREAVQKAADSADCPVCEVLKDGRPVGAVV